MKPITRLATITALVLFPFYFLVKSKRIVCVILLFVALFLTGCFQHYYRTHTQTAVNKVTIQKLMSANKYFIIHFKNRLAELQNLSISNDQLEADLVDVEPEHLKYINPVTTKANRVKRIDKPITLLEVHLYYPQDVGTDQTHLSIPVSGLNRLDIYEFDKKATRLNHTLSAVGVAVIITGATVLLTAALVAVIVDPCNCPQVCINKNGEYQFVSGVYSGAVYSSLERTDYLPLPALNNTDDIFRIKINNVKDEEQFMNRFQLLEVRHTAGTNVLLDRRGKVFSYNNPIEPVSAVVDKMTDIRKQLALTDDDKYLFDSEKNEAGFSSTTLTFNKPVGSQKAKLIVHGGNSLWSGYLYHSFAELFGTGYEKWKNEKDRSDPEEMEKWQTDQGLPLLVYVERNGKWVFADYFAHTGNTASRDMIMELDLSDIRSDLVKIKLETVYQFWNLDFAGIDFSANDNATSILLDPSKAQSSDGTDQIQSLRAIDKDYAFLKSNEVISLEYNPSLLSDGTKKSYFLVSTGYYHNMKKYEGSPKMATLIKFKNKHGFDDFSREKFNDIQKTLNGYAVESRQ